MARRLRVCGSMSFVHFVWIGITLMMALPAARAADPRDDLPWRWRVANSARDRAATAIARSTRGVVAQGGEGGLLIRAPDSWPRPMRVPGLVRDLTFDAAGSLWVASEGGLFRVPPGTEALEARPPASGEGARAVWRIAEHAGWLAAIADRKVYWSADGTRWHGVDAALGEAPRALAIGGSDRASVFVGGARGLFRFDLPASGERRALPGVARAVPLPAGSRAVIDCAVAGEWLFVLTPKWVFRAAFADAPIRWQRFALPTPPGASPTRLAASSERVVVGTERGLLESRDAGASWRSAPAPAGRTPVADLALWPGGIALAGQSGVMIGEAQARVSMATRAAPSPPTCEASVVAVQRAATAHLRLRGVPLRRQRRDVRRRAWLPTLRLDAQYGNDRARSRDLDQHFVSGATRELYDWEHDRRRARDIALTMTWDFGALLYHPEEIDISTEARRLIELRDDVLDEINQLYFDREREVERARNGDDAEARSARLRARELAAGLDAWTDGWFSEQAGCGVP